MILIIPLWNINYCKFKKVLLYLSKNKAKMKTNNIMVGKFSTNEWINNDFKGFAFKKANKNAKHKFFVMLNPYEPITECGKIPKELKKKDTIKDTDGHILKVVDFGGSGLFGKDHWSWTWIGFYCLNGEFVKQQ